MIQTTYMITLAIATVVIENNQIKKLFVKKEFFCYTLNMKYIINDYSHLTGIGEISDKVMQMHLKLYEGYVNNTNSILEKLADENLKSNTPEWNELNRRLGWEWNGMRNHELFFESLTPLSSESNNVVMQEVLTKHFGSFETWKKSFENICKIRGIGWAMLVQDKRTKEILNTWVNEHDAGMLSDVNIILNFDMFEHAYISDFGTDRQKYLDSLFAHINWNVISQRLI